MSYLIKSPKTTTHTFKSNQGKTPTTIQIQDNSLIHQGVKYNLILKHNHRTTTLPTFMVTRDGSPQECLFEISWNSYCERWIYYPPNRSGFCSYVMISPHKLVGSILQDKDY